MSRMCYKNGKLRVRWRGRGPHMLLVHDLLTPFSLLHSLPLLLFLRSIHPSLIPLIDGSETGDQWEERNVLMLPFLRLCISLRMCVCENSGRRKLS